MSTETDTTVVICAYTMRRWNDICEAIHSVQQSRGVTPEIVLVSDNNAELLAKAKSEFPNIVVVPNHFEPGLSGARNTGIEVARGAFIAFLDDDAVAEADWLAKVRRHFTDPTIIGVAARILPQWMAPNHRWFPDEFRWAIGSSHPNLPATPTVVRNLFGGAMCIRRDAFAVAGGFDSNLGRTASKLPTSCEETEWCLRAVRTLPDARFIVEPGAQVLHKVPAGRLTWRYLVLRSLAEGISKARLGRIAGRKGLLSEEKKYVGRTLTAAVLRNLLDVLFRADVYGLARIAAIIAGLSAATTGYVVGYILPLPQRSPRRTAIGRPIESGFPADVKRNSS